MRHLKLIYPSSKPGADFINQLCEKVDFENALEGLRKKWKIDVASEIFLLENRPELANQYRLLKNKKFISDIKKFQKKFELGEEWSSFIEDYIFIDFFVYKKESNLFIEKRTGKESDSITGKPAYYLKIFPETTQEDIVKGWDQINEFIHGNKKKNKRLKSSSNYSRDKKVYKLAKLGFCIEDIDNYFRERQQPFHSYDAIIKAESRYRKKMDIEDKNRLGYRKNNLQLTNLQKLASTWPDE